MRKNSVKNIRINSEVQKELSNIIRNEMKDPRISPWTSVVSVEVAPDLKSCKAYISVLGDDEAVKAALKKTVSSFKDPNQVNEVAEEAMLCLS